MGNSGKLLDRDNCTIKHIDSRLPDVVKKDVRLIIY